MKFLDINLTKDSSLLLHFIHISQCLQLADLTENHTLTLVLKTHIKNPQNKKTRVYSWISFCRREKRAKKTRQNLESEKSLVYTHKPGLKMPFKYFIPAQCTRNKSATILVYQFIRRVSWRRNPIGQTIFFPRMRDRSPLSTGGRPTSTFWYGAILLDNTFYCACATVFPHQQAADQSASSIMEQSVVPILLRMRASTHHQNAGDQPASSLTEQSYRTTHFTAHACQYSPSKAANQPASCKWAIPLDHPFCCACVPVLTIKMRPTNQHFL